MDPTVIDYDQDSDEEWEEIHGENLEDDDMLIEEENMEVEQDEAEKLQGTQTTFPDQNYLPHTGVSNAIK